MQRYLPYVGPLIGLTGVTLALYFHAQSAQERDPMFYASPQRAVIVDATGPKSSDLQVLYHGTPVNASVVALTVYIWNDGRLPIRKDDVLGAPITIDLSRPSEILEARLNRVSRSVTGFIKGMVNESAKNSLPVFFDILERSDGAAIQIIYAGDPKASLTVSGTIVGAGAPRPLHPGGWFSSPGTFFSVMGPKWGRRFDLFFGCFLIVMAIISASLSLYLNRRGAWDFKLDLRTTLDTLSFLACLVLGVAMLYSFYHGPSPGVPLGIWTGA